LFSALKKLERNRAYSQEFFKTSMSR
jgi:hypothetical protein